ncbi:PWI domain-containing protein [Martensiomyces pterosporus]|nr:PWI domain-containing protein [Martensiomyces pterosporus]
MAGGFFRGTNTDQDQRFGDASKKLLKDMSFSALLKRKVDMSKVNMEVVKPWIATKINETLGIEDEVLFEYVVNMLEESSTPDPKTMQLNLTGFLESKTQGFMQSLWAVLLEAQQSQGGVPESFIRDKVEEIRRKRAEEASAKENIRAANERIQQGASVSRRMQSGRKSRWDTASNADAVSAPSTAESRKSPLHPKDGDRSTRGHRHRHHSRRHSSDRDRSRSRSRSRSKSPRRHRRSSRSPRRRGADKSPERAAPAASSKQAEARPRCSEPEAH